MVRKHVDMAQMALALLVAGLMFGFALWVISLLIVGSTEGL